MWIVGMHHWGPRQLEVGHGYQLELEPDNPKDPNAICIKSDGHRRHTLLNTRPLFYPEY